MILLEGKKVIEKKQENLLKLSNKCYQKYGKKPTLAILSNTNDEASKIYVQKIEKNCDKFNINVNFYFSDNEDDFRSNFLKINDDKNITAIMFQEPISNNLKQLIEQIDPIKDVEGITSKNLGKLFFNTNDKIVPCTAKAVIDILDYYKIDVQGKKVVVLGRSNIVGKPLLMELISKNATVTLCHSKSIDVQEETKNADIVIVAIGKANYLKGSQIKEGATVIDVGINYMNNGKIVGDVDFDSVKEKTFAITPVPGGVGIVTNYTLIENIFKTFEIQNEK